MVATPDETDRLYLGCKFSEPLGPLHLRRLGVSTVLANEVPPSPLPPPPAPKTHDVQVRARAEDGDGAVGGDGSLVEVDDHMLTMSVPYGDASALAGSLGMRPVSLYVHDKGARVWAARGHLLSVRWVETPASVELGFLTSQDPRPVLGPRIA
jgi:hypothetical protein